jgi:hypothetical protein
MVPLRPTYEPLWDEDDMRALAKERDGLMQTLRDEMDENLRLRELGGAGPDENITAMTERVIAERDELRMKRMVDDWVKRDAYRYRKLVMQQHKHWLGVFRCDPDGAPSDSISHDELAKLLDAMGGPEMDGAANPAPAKRPTWVEILLLVNEYTSHVADASQHKAASRQDISKSAALATLGRLRTLLGYEGG